MISKSLVQISVDGWSLFLPASYLGPNYGGGKEDNGDLFQKIHACTATPTAPNPVADHHQPTPPLETPGHSRASLGQSLAGSLLLSPGSWCTQVSVCALAESVSPVLCKFWRLYGGLMPTSSKSTYAIPRSTALRAPPPAAVHCGSITSQETPRHSSVSVSVGSLGPGVHKVCLSLLSISGRYGV